MKAYVICVAKQKICFLFVVFDISHVRLVRVRMAISFPTEVYFALCGLA